ncbi:Ldh family oxidoreductase [Nocardioides acrostichi]|uniref:Ldh family oxidoreductase n=1 Tax=Nocardioides acrostichi TaxID=2784339 RepID=A0A930Y8I9_9ACTN|nr:Ldh family oxidoreductase [Nocardioides acrostichi]MBF4163147.1 Ldh family oxidoreductase [Nocardioides acrostichi]
MIRVSHQEWVRVCSQILSARGMPSDDAASMARLMVDSDAAGHESHGLWRLPQYIDDIERGLVNVSARPTIEEDRGAWVRIHGDHGFGHLVLAYARDLAISRARRFGVSAVAVRRSAFAGRLADFCEVASTENAMIVVVANDAGGGQAVAPHGGSEARLSTNPIAAGIPRVGAPLVIDMATSVVASGRLGEHGDRGEAVPEHWRTSAGALRPAGGPKGYALALIVEALAGGLTRAGTVRRDPGVEDQGALVIAFDLGDPTSAADFKEDVEGFLEWVLSSRPEHPDAPVLLPGQRATRTREERLRSGIPVTASTFDRIARLCDLYDVPAAQTMP